VTTVFLLNLAHFDADFEIRVATLRSLVGKYSSGSVTDNDERIAYSQYIGITLKGYNSNLAHGRNSQPTMRSRFVKHKAIELTFQTGRHKFVRNDGRQ
jgi:hypothetical protein